MYLSITSKATSPYVTCVRTAALVSAAGVGWPGKGKPGNGTRHPTDQAVLYSFSCNGRTSSYRVKLLVEPTRVAYISTICILSPERGLCGQAIGTKNTGASTPLKWGKKKTTRSEVSHMITGVRPNQPRSSVFRPATMTV